MDNPETQDAPPSNAEPPESLDLSGTTLGDFQILRRLGQGGMGQVYLAEQVSLKRKVALKLLRKEVVSNELALRRFEREAKLVAQATHANIVQVYAFGADKGLRYMALEYVDGRSLRDFVEKKGPPDILLGIHILRQVASALQRASELGIVHRDIKPDNILLTRKVEVKVADFGLSLADTLENVPKNLTQSGITMGTPLYMAPEQVEGKPVDARTDIYSFGVTAYHLFTGHPPFRGTSPLEVAYQHVHTTPKPLREIRPDLPPELCAIIHKMLAKRPEERYQTAREIVRDMSRLRDLLVGVASPASGTIISIGSGPVPAAPGDLTDSALTQFVPTRGGRQTRRGWVLACLALLMLAVGGVVGWYVHRDRGDGSVLGPPPSVPGELLLPLPNPLREKEERLVKAFKPYINPTTKPEILEGRAAAVELGMFYLETRKLDEAERFFRELDASKEGNPPYREIALLGQAMTLAFQGKAEQANQLFLQVIERRKNLKSMGPRGGAPWVVHPQVRRLMAEALQHNKINLGLQNLPDGLEVLATPPGPMPRATSKIN